MSSLTLLLLQPPPALHPPAPPPPLQEVAQACKVSAMPTFQAYFNGQLVDTLVGADPHKLRDMIKE